MLKRSIKMQMSTILNSKSVIIVYFILLGAVFFNFYNNMGLFKNGDVTQMMDPYKLSSISTWTKVRFYLMQFYPLLLVFPTATFYFDDKNSQIDYYIQSRVGMRNYIFSKAVAVFIITFILFSFPFVMEVLIYSIVVPLSAQGDPSGFQYFQTIETNNLFFMSSLYYFNEVIYTIISILVFSLATSVLALFNFSLTTIKHFRFRVFTFFPIYLLFYIIIIISSYCKIRFTTNYFLILPIFSTPTVSNYILYFSFYLTLFMLSCFFILLKIKRRAVL